MITNVSFKQDFAMFWIIDYSETKLNLMYDKIPEYIFYNPDHCIAFYDPDHCRMDQQSGGIIE